MPTTVRDREMLTVRDAATTLRVSERTIRRLIARDELPALRVGASIRIDGAALNRWLDKETA